MLIKPTAWCWVPFICPLRSTFPCSVAGFPGPNLQACLVSDFSPKVTWQEGGGRQAGSSFPSSIPERCTELRISRNEGVILRSGSQKLEIRFAGTESRLLQGHVPSGGRREESMVSPCPASKAARIPGLVATHHSDLCFPGHPFSDSDSPTHVQILRIRMWVSLGGSITLYAAFTNSKYIVFAYDGERKYNKCFSDYQINARLL